jgi:hypothetical protein
MLHIHKFSWISDAIYALLISFYKNHQNAHRYPGRYIREDIWISEIRRIPYILYSYPISEPNISICIRYLIKHLDIQKELDSSPGFRIPFETNFSPTRNWTKTTEKFDIPKWFDMSNFKQSTFSLFLIEKKPFLAIFFRNPPRTHVYLLKIKKFGMTCLYFIQDTMHDKY